MNGRIIDGRAVASDVEKGLRPRIDALTQEGRAPHLAVVIVGADPASQVYVGAKVRACERLGITSTRIDLDANITMEALESMVMDLNADPTIDGILVQSPLPEGHDELRITDAIDPRKDVDGFHPSNLGRLVQGRMDGLIPCTPAGILDLLATIDVDLTGADVAVLGRSRIVGMPMALLLAARGRTRPSRSCIPNPVTSSRGVVHLMSSSPRSGRLRWSDPNGSSPALWSSMSGSRGSLWPMASAPAWLAMFIRMSSRWHPTSRRCPGVGPMTIASDGQHRSRRRATPVRVRTFIRGPHPIRNRMMMRHPIISLQARALMFTLTILTLVNAFLGRWPGHPDRRYDVLILLKSTLDTNGYGSIADRVPVSDTSAWTSTGLGLQEGVVAVVLVLLVIIDLWARRTRRLPSISTRTTSEQLQNLETMPTTVSGSEPGRRVNPLTARIIAGVRGESAEVDQSELESGLALMSETQPAPQPVTPTTYVRAEPMSGGRLPPSTLGDSDPEPMSMLAPPGVLPPAPDPQPVPRIDPPPVAVGGVVRTATGGRIEIDLGEVIAPQQPGPSGGRLAPLPWNPLSGNASHSLVAHPHRFRRPLGEHSRAFRTSRRTSQNLFADWHPCPNRRWWLNHRVDVHCPRRCRTFQMWTICSEVNMITTVDLHSHSTHSDGLEDVTTMARRAHANGVRIWALTDHDSVEGWPEGQRAATSLGLRFIPGIEMTCEPATEPQDAILRIRGLRPPSSWHLLAYFPDADDGTRRDLRSWLNDHAVNRGPRMQAMVDRLNEAGYTMSFEEVEAIAQGGQLGRPHLARAMVDRGYVPTVQAAFDDWLHDGGPISVRAPLPTLQDAVDVVRTRWSDLPRSSMVLWRGYRGSRGCGSRPWDRCHRMLPQCPPPAFIEDLVACATDRGIPSTVGGDSHGTESRPSPGGMVIPTEHLHPRFRPERQSLDAH